MLTRQNTVGCFENASNSDKESALNTTKNKNVCAKHNDHSGASDRNYAPAPRVGGIKQWCASDVCLPVAYIGPKSTTRPRKTKIGTEVAHVIRDSDTTFKVKRSTCRGRGAYCGGLPHSLLYQNRCIESQAACEAALFTVTKRAQITNTDTLTVICWTNNQQHIRSGYSVSVTHNAYTNS